MIAGLLLTATVSCTPTSRPTPSIRIGMVLSPAREARLLATARLAVEEVNARGGLELPSGPRPVELVIGDSHDSPEGAVTAAGGLINRQGIVALLGPFDSHDAIPVARLAEEARLPMMTPGSTSSETTAGKRYVFRAGFTNTAQGQAMARFARHELRAARAAVLYDGRQVLVRRFDP